MPPDSTNLSTYVLEFGKKHRGERIQRVPYSYLSWMVREHMGPYEVARQEIARRGITLPDVELSGHAIDSASLRIRKTWHEDREKSEGLHSWLMRATKAAIAQGEEIEPGAFVYLQVKWVVTVGGEWPSLKTVYPYKKKQAETWWTQLDDYTCTPCRGRHGMTEDQAPRIFCENPNGCRCVIASPSEAEGHS